MPLRTGGAAPKWYAGQKFSRFSITYERHGSCFIQGMMITMILIGAQLVLMLVSLLRDSGEDTRFEGDKLTFRS